MSLSDLPKEALEAVAALLLDARDIAAFRCSCRAVDQLYSSTHLWRRVLAARFGPQHVPDDPAEAEAEFRELSSLRKPVIDLGTKIHFSRGADGGYLVPERRPAGSVAEEVVRLNAVCWLELGDTLPGLLPGRYVAAWRLELLGHFYIDDFSLSCTLPPGRGTGSSVSITWEQMRALYGEVGTSWVWLCSLPFEVTQLCPLTVWLKGTSGNWKRNILFDTVALVPAERLGPAAAGQLLYIQD